MKVSGVYKITNTATGDFYIGSSKDVKRRWVEHKKPSVWKRYSNNPMYLDMLKYGVDKFDFQILEEVESEQLKKTEQQFIETLKPTYNSNNANGLNIERFKEYQIEYYQQNRENKKEYYQQNRENKKEYQIEYYQKNRENKKKYYNQLCSYNGEILTLNALKTRFQRAGVEHCVLEAKKYLLNNVIEFYDVYP